MKKFVMPFLVFVMMFSLVACGEKITTNNDGTNGNNTTNNSEKTSSVQKETTNGDKDTENEITFTEMVVIDNEECIIKVTGIEPGNKWGYTINVLLENKSADKTYIFDLENAAINGVQCDPYFAIDVLAGKKANEEICFENHELENAGFIENGITEYTDIELSFCVFDSENKTTGEVAKETIHIYPFGEEKAEKYVREAQASDNVIIDNDYVTAIVTGYEQDGRIGYTGQNGYIVNLFLINKTDKTIIFKADETSVNGFMADPFYMTCVAAGKSAFSSMAWPNSTLEENSITEVEVIEFKFRANDADNWPGEYFADEVITLNP